MNYQEWKKVIEKNFPEVVFPAEACMSAVAQLWFEDIELPCALVLVGRPADYKTTVLDFFTFFEFFREPELKDLVFYTDKFTPQSFVSHKADVKPEQLEKIDLLPKIQDKIFIVPELAPIFTQTGDKLTESLGILTRVLDGKGYMCDSGSHGHRGYRGKYKFVWLAATTPVPHRVWRCMGNLGTKIYFLRMPKRTLKPSDILKILKERDYNRALAECRMATKYFIQSLIERTPVKWENEKDDESVLEKIGHIAILLARLRGAVNVSVQEEYDPVSGKIDKINYTIPIIENPTRAAIMLKNFVRGYAFIKGRNHIENEDLKMAIEIALSSAPEDRVRAFDVILRYNGEITAADLEEEMGFSRSTALRALNTLQILGIVKKSTGTSTGGRPPYKARLVKDLEWFLTDEFWKMRGKERPKPKQHKPDQHDTPDFFSQIGHREGEKK